MQGNVVLKSARIDVGVLEMNACTARNTVIRILDAASARLGVLRMIVLQNCARIAICCAVPTDASNRLWVVVMLNCD